MAVHISNTSIVLTDLPMSISENNAYPTNQRTGRRYASTELGIFKQQMAMWSMDNIQTLTFAKGVIGLWDTISMKALIGFRRDRVYTKDGRVKRIDAANFLKVLQDGVSKSIARDDCYFWSSAVDKAPLKIGDTRERCTVILTPAVTIDLADWHKSLMIM